MKKRNLLLAALVLASLPAAPALAGWKLVPHAKPIAVAKGTLTVTPAEDWNRWSVRPIKKGEVWTLDGVGLNEVYFVSGLIVGETLYRDADKKNRPLPTLTKAMTLTDIPEFFESSNRIALNTSVFTLTGVEPAKMGDRDAVKFSYEYAVEGSPLKRQGIAVGSLSGGMLYLISYTAPATHFFEQNRAKVEAIMASAHY
jgi:hypothetical protein